MSRSQSWKNLVAEGEKVVDLRRASSQPLHSLHTTENESSLVSSNASSKSTMEDMRRRIVQLNKELEKERICSKNLQRDKAFEIRQVRDEEQRKAAAMQADLKSKLMKEKLNEIASVKDQLYKEKEKDILQIIRQKDEALRTAQQSWAKEKEEMRSKLRNDLRNESRGDTKREFEKERGRLESDIAELHRQKRELEETLKLVQDADKRKIDDIRRIHHEHEAVLEKFKRNSWQESRQQMAEIRQLLYIIEQLEKKLGLEAGHSMRLRLEKDNLYDMLKKSTTFDAWDRMMSSTMKDEQGRTTLPSTSDTKSANQELRILQRKNVELSSLVRKLDEKNQQLATRNAELMAELEKVEKDNRDKSRKLERKNVDLTQINKKLESRNKMLLDEVNVLKKSLTSRKDSSVKPRGRNAKEQDELNNLRAQLREQTRNNADLKQSLLDKDRRIELLKSRQKMSKRKSSSPMATSLSADFMSVEDDDTLSVHSDFSEFSEMSSSDDADSKRIKKLAKELLALERAYALLQAHVGSVVDAERDEMEKQQLQSDLIESQTRIHELERMMAHSGQVPGSEELSQLQADNRDLYQKLVSTEEERDKAQAELAKYSEDVRELKDQRDLLEFELEEMSQLSTTGSEDWDSRRPRSTCSLEALSFPRRDDDSLSLEEIKACLEELETEKENVLSPLQQSGVKQARMMLESMAEKINHLEITESALRDKVRDLDLGYNSESLKSEFQESRRLSVFTCDKESLTDVQLMELEDKLQQLEVQERSRNLRLDILTEDTCCMTDLIWEDLVNMESMYKKHINALQDRNGGDDKQNDVNKKDNECMTDLVWQELVELEESYRNYLEDLLPLDVDDEHSKHKGETNTVDNETMTDLNFEELEEIETCYHRYLDEKVIVKSRYDAETMTDIVWEELLQRISNQVYLSLSEESNEKERDVDVNEVGIMTDLGLSELVKMEEKYLAYVEDDLAIEVQNENLVEALPEIVLDTFPEDFIENYKDEYAMTDLTCNDIINLQDKCCAYERDIQDLQDIVATYEVQKEEKGSCTEMPFTDLTFDELVNLQAKCSGYESAIKELEEKLAYWETARDKKARSSESSINDVAVARFDIETKDAQIMTDISEDVMNNKGFPEVVLATFPSDRQTKDECDMTDIVWDEVVDLKNTYQDYRENLEEMKQKLAQFEVEKDDKESITDIAMQDLVDLQSMYREHLRDVDSDTYSLLSHTDKESKECMTELTCIEVAELEDFYIDNAARELAASPIVEKWEQESMTDITLDDMQYLEEAEDVFRRTGSAAEKYEKCTETELSGHDVENLQETATRRELLQTVKKVEVATLTSLTIPELECLEDTYELHQDCAAHALSTLGKVDMNVGTVLTAEDLKYWEDVEAAHEECLLDREDEKGIKEKQDAEIMTDFTMSDLQYLEEVDAAQEACLFDKEGRKRPNIESASVEVMTELGVSDIQYLEDFESTYEHDNQVSEARDVENAEMMTDMTMSDLEYLEEVEVAHEECLVDLLDKQDEFEKKQTAVEKESVEIMTDMTFSYLQYLEDVETAHKESLLEERIQLKCETTDSEMQSVSTMTEMTKLDLRSLEFMAFEKEKTKTPKMWRRRPRSSSLTDHRDHRCHHYHKNTMTEITGNMLDYYEDIEALYKENVVEIDVIKRLHYVEKEEKGVITEVTFEDLKELEEKSVCLEFIAASKHDRQSIVYDGEEIEGNQLMTGLLLDSAEHSMEGEISCRESDRYRSFENVIVRCHAETMTELTLSDIENAEEELDRLHGQLNGTDSSWVVIEPEKVDRNVMTEMTESDLQHLQEVEVLFNEKNDEPPGVVRKDDAGAMTDLTTADLEYLEEAESLMRKISGDGGNIAALLAPKDEKQVITDMRSSDIDYLQVLADVYDDTNRGSISEAETEKYDKVTETELTIADIRDLEDQVSSEAVANAMQPLQEFVNDDLRAETLVDLQSELDYLPILDEPEFILDEEDKAEDIQRAETGIMTEMTIADITDLEDQIKSATEVNVAPPVEDNLQAEIVEGLQTEGEYLPVLEEPEIILDEEINREFTRIQDTGVMTELTLIDLENVASNAVHRCDDDFELYKKVEASVQCDLEDLTSFMQELTREAEENGENVPTWFVSALRLWQPEGGFNPVRILVRESDSVDAFPAGGVLKLQSQNEDIVEETPFANTPSDSKDPPAILHDTSINGMVPDSWIEEGGEIAEVQSQSEDVVDEKPFAYTLSDSEDPLTGLHVTHVNETARDSWISEEGDASFKEVGVQCDLVNFLAMLEEYQRNTDDDVTPWFVSAVNLSRDFTGYDPVEVNLKDRSHSSPVQDVAYTTSARIELSHPPSPAKSSTFTRGFSTHGQIEEHQFEFPEADSPDPLLASQDGSDSVFNRTDESFPPPTTEERDVLTEMPQSSSAVNRFDRFLKERKDSELLNLQTLKENMDTNVSVAVFDVKTLKELEEENELLRRQIADNAKSAEELESELAALKEKVESVTDLDHEHPLQSVEELQSEIVLLREKVKSVDDLEEENQLLKEEVYILRESAAAKDMDVENQTRDMEEMKTEVAALKEKVESARGLDEENQVMQTEIAVLKEKVQSVYDLEEQNQLLKGEISAMKESARARGLEEEYQSKTMEALQREVTALKEKEESARGLDEENQVMQTEIAVLKEKVQSVYDLEEENQLLKGEIIAMKESARARGLEEEYQSKTMEALQREVTALKEKEESAKDLEEENKLLKEEIDILRESSSVKSLEEESQLQIIEEMQNEIAALKEKVKSGKDLEDEIQLLNEEVIILRESASARGLEEENQLQNEKELRTELATLKGKVESLKVLEEENQLLKEEINMLRESAAVRKLREDSQLQHVEELQSEITALKGKLESAKDLEEENQLLKEEVNISRESVTVERLENEQLMEKIQDLQDSTARVVDRLEEENSNLKQNIQILEDSTTNMEDLEEDNVQLRKKIESLGASRDINALEEENLSLKERIRSLEESSARDIPNEEFELLKLKIEQLQEAEKKIGALNENNMALKEKIDLLQIEKKNVRENWSEMDPSEQLGKSDRGVQADIPGGVQLLKLLQVAPDGTVSENIAKELAKLKEENMTLYEELMALRRKIKAREVAQRLNEATQTDPETTEQVITPQVRATVEVRYVGDSYFESESSPEGSSTQVEGFNLDGQDGLVRYPGLSKGMLSDNENVRDSVNWISEQELVSSQRNLDSAMDDIDRRIQDPQYLGREHVTDRPRTDTSDLIACGSDDDGDLPPLPESSPPPPPTGPPPDSPPVLDYGFESLLSSPPRDAATLRASSRARSHSENKGTSEPSQPSSRVESPVTVEEPTLVLASDPAELGGAYPEPSTTGPSSVRRPTGESSNKVPPKVFPKPRKILQMRQAGQRHKPLVPYRHANMTPKPETQLSRDEEDGVIPPRGIVFNRASSINRGEIDALNEKIGFLERQLKNKENVIRSMKSEATDLETRSLLERKDREMKILEEDVAFLKKENQKKERELLTKIGEMNKKNYEAEQWKTEANNSERQRQRMEEAYVNLQIQMKDLQGAELKLAELQAKHTGMEKQNFELSEKVKKLEKTEKEFKKLEHNIQLLQTQVEEMDVVEQDRNSLLERMKIIENQRDDLLKKGRIVESERNDFLRNNKLMEMQRDDLENRCAMLQKTNATLNSRVAELERDVREAQTKMHDSLHERNYLQVQLDKMESEKNEMQKRLAITTQERNSLENQVAELQELSRDHAKLEEGFHTLRIKLAESTREKDDAEMQIPTLKAKIALLKRACKEKDELVDELSEEIRELRHAIATSALDDLSKIRTSGYTPENFVKLSAKREKERQITRREPQDLVGDRLKSKPDKQVQRRSPRAFASSPPGTKKTKRYVALFDYDPYKSPASEHPELELKLKEGDFLTVFGDMDTNGYFEADVNGARGLVPSLYVDEIEDDNDSDVSLEELLARSLRAPEKIVPPYKTNEPLLQRDAVSSGRITPSSGTSSVGSEPRQCMVALDDYDPFQSGASGLPPHQQLSLRKGDVMTAYGDVDEKGFYRVDLNGLAGFVPSHLVEEVSSSSFLQPTSSRAPEQILGMLDNIQLPRETKGLSTDAFSPAGAITNGYSTHAQTDVAIASDARLRGNRLPSVGLTRFKPSPEVAKLGPSLKLAATPLDAVQSSQPPVRSMVPQVLDTAKSSPPSKQIVPVSSHRSRPSRKAHPSPPSFFRVLRPVNHDAMLLGWTLPEMDEFGRSNGLTVKGYKIYANSDVKLEVRSPYMTKALVEDLDLRCPIKFNIKTVAENGSSSEVVSATFTDTTKRSLMDSPWNSFEVSEDDQKPFRTFVALYDYDPFKSSPNPNPASELNFKEGDILRVLDTSRKDGFYVGKLKAKTGLIPSNFVEEVAVASPRRLDAAKRRQAALSSPTRPLSRESGSSGGLGSSPLAPKEYAPTQRKTMIALYDYNPEIQSPQDNPDSELALKKGQIVTVLGEMRADGFYHADMNGQFGLVPSTFLDVYTNGETDSGLDSERRVSFEKGRAQRHLGGLNRV